jgi:hypothetical protein
MNIALVGEKFKSGGRAFNAVIKKLNDELQPSVEDLRVRISQLSIADMLAVLPQDFISQQVKYI